MSKIAIVFPGQGAQYAGMGKEIADNYKEAMDIFDKANQVLGFDLKNLCFEGPEAELAKTENTQPAILTTSIALYKVLENNGIKPNMAFFTAFASELPWAFMTPPSIPSNGAPPYSV